MSERYDRVCAIFNDVCDLGPAERTDALARLCGDDDALRSEVGALLREHDDPQLLAGTADRQQVIGGAARAIIGGRGPEVGSAFGAYQIEDVLGQGGMGTVFVARQAHPDRRVALKVINAGVVSPQVLSRFNHEAQVLGRLRHPGIAQVYEAGTVDTGFGDQPYFAMELVDGVTLDHFIERNEVAMRDRLRLLADIGHAVHHAHQKGVIHRDLKPANILVDVRGNPRVLDFGVARVTDEDVRSATLQTTEGQIVGTVPYMSPEQIAGDPEQLDVRSDVYALGVVAYELLSGKLPHDVRRRSLAEAARMIQEDSAASLSSIDRMFRGDIDTIIAKALSKEPDMRYQSAAELSEDIERYLGDEPINARPPSTWYQLRKFSRRHRAFVAGVVGVMLTLALGVIGTGYGLLLESRRAGELTVALEQVTEAEKLAVERGDEAEAVTDFLSDLLSSASPGEDGKDVLVVDLLDRSSATLGAAMDGKPRAEVRIRQTLSDAYRALTNTAAALESARLTVEVAERTYGDDDPATLLARRTYARALCDDGAYLEAEAILREVVAAHDKREGPDGASTLGARNSLALALVGLDRAVEAEAIITDVVERYRARETAADDSAELAALANLASTLDRTDPYGDHRELRREVIERRIQLFGEDDYHVLRARNDLALEDQRRGDITRAMAEFESVLVRQRERLGVDHLDTQAVMRNLSGIYVKRARFDEAEALLLESIEATERSQGPDHISLAFAWDGLGYLYLQKTTYEAAIDAYTKSVAIRTEQQGPGHLQTLVSRGNLLVAISGSGDRAGALDGERELVAEYQAHIGPDHPSTLVAVHNLGHNLRENRQVEAALPYCQEAYEKRRERLGENDRLTLLSMQNYALTLLYNRRFDEAAELALDCAERGRQHLERSDTFQAIILMTAGRVHKARRQPDASIALYDEALDQFRPLLGDDHAYVRRIELYRGRAVELQEELAAKAPDTTP